MLPARLDLRDIAVGSMREKTAWQGTCTATYIKEEGD